MAGHTGCKCTGLSYFGFSYDAYLTGNQTNPAMQGQQAVAGVPDEEL